MFLHWLVGMVYVFYFASFVLLLREVLRPGVLWFLRNLNDPDFQPVQEVRKFSLSSKKFCTLPFFLKLLLKVQICTPLTSLHFFFVH